MIENFIFAGNNANIDKFISPKELDCRKNYAIVCRADERGYPWDYAGNTMKIQIVGLSETSYVITDTSSSPHVSIPLFGSFS